MKNTDRVDNNFRKIGEKFSLSKNQLGIKVKMLILLIRRNISFLCLKIKLVLKAYYKNISGFIDKHKLRPIVDVLIFMVIIVFFHFLWWDWGFKDLLLNYFSFAELEQFMAYQVFWPSAWIVEHIIGYDITTLNTTLYFPNNGYIAVNGSCSGLKQFYQWIFLMVLFPGPWKQKLWFIPLGLLVIHLTNIFRIVVLSVILMNWPDYWQASHDWLLRPFFYVVIFALWMLWEEKFRFKKVKKSEPKTDQ
jgi:exosortase/archaeosortase family protein